MPGRTLPAGAVCRDLARTGPTAWEGVPLKAAPVTPIGSGNTGWGTGPDAVMYMGPVVGPLALGHDLWPGLANALRHSQWGAGRGGGCPTHQCCPCTRWGPGVCVMPLPRGGGRASKESCFRDLSKNRSSISQTIRIFQRNTINHCWVSSTQKLGCSV